MRFRCRIYNLAKMPSHHCLHDYCALLLVSILFLTFLPVCQCAEDPPAEEKATQYTSFLSGLKTVCGRLEGLFPYSLIQTSIGVIGIIGTDLVLVQNSDWTGYRVPMPEDAKTSFKIELSTDNQFKMENVFASWKIDNNSASPVKNIFLIDGPSVVLQSESGLITVHTSKNETKSGQLDDASKGVVFVSTNTPGKVYGLSPGNEGKLCLVYGSWEFSSEELKMTSTTTQSCYDSSQVSQGFYDQKSQYLFAFGQDRNVTVLDITDNEVKVLSQSTMQDMFICKDYNPMLLIGLLVTAILVLIFIIILIVCCCKKCRGGNKAKIGGSSSSGTSSGSTSTQSKTKAKPSKKSKKKK